MRDAWVEIDTNKLAANFTAVKNAVGGNVKICAVLKAGCYGMSGPEVSKIFHKLGAHMFATAVLSEALEIRRAAGACDILILGYLSPRFFKLAVDNDISLSAYNPELVEILGETACGAGKRARIHIKVNTGMNRLGFLPTEENADIVKKISSLPGITIGGVFTHFARADEADKTTTHEQARRFESFVAMLNSRGVACGLVHAANSPSLCDLPEYDYDMVRPGLIFTGIYASDEVSRDRVKVTPCVRLLARLGSVALLPAGEGIGYGHTYRLEKETLVGILPVGFSDGFTRSFSNNFHVIVRGRKCNVIGNICMDHCVIDLSEVPDATVGDEIIVYGDGSDGALSIVEAAEKRGTVPDEVLTNLSSRLPRVFV
jgi:alanine racemase